MHITLRDGPDVINCAHSDRAASTPLSRTATQPPTALRLFAAVIELQGQVERQRRVEHGQALGGEHKLPQLWRRSTWPLPLQTGGTRVEAVCEALLLHGAGAA